MKWKQLVAPAAVGIAAFLGLLYGDVGGIAAKAGVVVGIIIVTVLGGWYERRESDREAKRLSGRATELAADASALLVDRHLLVLCQRLYELGMIRANVMLPTTRGTLCPVFRGMLHPDVDFELDKDLELYRGEGVAGCAFLSGQICVADLRDLPAEYRLKQPKAEALTSKLTGIISIPLTSRDGKRRLGVLNVDTIETDPTLLLSRSSQDVARDMAGMIGPDVEEYVDACVVLRKSGVRTERDIDPMNL